MNSDNGVTIETATIDDVEAIVDCWVSLVADQQQYGSTLKAAANRTVVTERIARKIIQNELLVARGNGICGFVMFETDGGVYSQTESIGTITNLFVKPASRDSGVGSRLLAGAESALATAGVTTVSVEVLAANDDARRLYDRQEYDTYRIELRKQIENDTHSKDDD